MITDAKLRDAAVKIGIALGKADRTAHQVARASQLAKEEFLALVKQAAAFKCQLEESAKRLKSVVG